MPSTGTSTAHPAALAQGSRTGDPDAERPLAGTAPAARECLQAQPSVARESVITAEAPRAPDPTEPGRPPASPGARTQHQRQAFWLLCFFQGGEWPPRWLLAWGAGVCVEPWSQPCIFCLGLLAPTIGTVSGVHPRLRGLGVAGGGRLERWAAFIACHGMVTSRGAASLLPCHKPVSPRQPLCLVTKWTSSGQRATRALCVWRLCVRV